MFRQLIMLPAILTLIALVTFHGGLFDNNETRNLKAASEIINDCISIKKNDLDNYKNNLDTNKKDELTTEVYSSNIQVLDTNEPPPV